MTNEQTPYSFEVIGTDERIEKLIADGLIQEGDVEASEMDADGFTCRYWISTTITGDKTTFNERLKKYVTLQ